ncbi:M23 family metallopeptidase [Bacillus pseudomycoides]|uniref:M23 family metallopeptidase n=1 Tax=Bacillus pseudomycoides TaxID=64104 RepID=UPI0001A1345C|nr:M23 family metallopeptidase [Bacillus pseudomycoides]EEM02861.1 Peptidase, M23/M37 [Bacillus pseudomycoides]KFN16159.1 peptidase M23 family protein [Bacillus pseudomycoides]MDR4185814.1 M23 family metallopeptidase [Bacillus pseudomycoides]MED0856038.1 M23 family metallopeptidase [Bacillus pseudomycoides]PFY85921.1 M23 family peptidase [Bacillus pseudomycoides]
MWKKIILTIFVVILLIGWSLIYLARGIVSIFAWWGIQAFSFFSIVILIITMTTIIWNWFFRGCIDKTIIFIFVLSIVGAWPACWFVGIGQIAYPADVHSATPKATIRLPLNQTALVGWGGNRLETNYHAWAPNQRWAYDFLVPPAGIKSSKLEDYGIYGAEVVAPASGTVISINTDEPDLKPGTDDFDSMAGNHIYLRLDETGTYLILAHLKRGSVRVKGGQHVTEGAIIAQVGNSGNSSEPHLHIHHQRQDPSKTSMFLSEGLPLYFRDIDGHAMPEGGIRVKNGNAVPIGDVISPLT